jgi:hypothetical protein
MKIKVTLSREYDTEGDDHAHLFEGVSDLNEYALRYFASDIDLMDYAEAKRQGIVEVSNV